MSDVELLREAAQTMRERAQAVEQGRWIADLGDSGQAWINLPAYPHAWGMHGFFEEAEHAAPFASPAVALAVADWLDREARRIGSHAISVYRVRDDWYAYRCSTCGHGGSASKAGVATWQDAHASLRLVADDAALAVARAFLGREPS